MVEIAVVSKVNVVVADLDRDHGMGDRMLRGAVSPLLVGTRKIMSVMRIHGEEDEPLAVGIHSRHRWMLAWHR
jgi:hypothetical protein